MACLGKFKIEQKTKCFDDQIFIFPHSDLRAREFSAVRRDIYRGASSSTSMELDPSNTDQAKNYMQNLLSTTSTVIRLCAKHRMKCAIDFLTRQWVSGLGSQFSDLIAAKYSLNGRSKRAWWINPGHKYGADTKYTLCSKIVVGVFEALINDDCSRFHNNRLQRIVPKLFLSEVLVLTCRFGTQQCSLTSTRRG